MLFKLKINIDLNVYVLNDVIVYARNFMFQTSTNNVHEVWLHLETHRPYDRPPGIKVNTHRHKKGRNT